MSVKGGVALLVSLLVICGCGVQSGETTRVQGPVFVAPRHCPKAGFGERRAQNPRAADQLWPEGASRALICREEVTLPFNTPGKRSSPTQSVRRSERILAGSKLAALESLMRSLGPDREGESTCPETNSVTYRIGVSYPDEPDLVVLAEYSGCEFVSNDVVRRTYGTSDSLNRFFASLFPAAG
jgi:hypothetical protein